MSTLRGCLLVPTSKNPDKGLWFIFHHESDGILAFDLTKEHPDIPYRHFSKIIDGEDRKPVKEKIVLLGGPMQSDSAMMVLHNNPRLGQDSHIVNDDFSFMSYRYVLVPGAPPQITKADDTPSRLDLGQDVDFIISMGFRLWDMDTLERELKNWQWTFLPATRDIVFHTPRQERLQKALLSIN